MHTLCIPTINKCTLVIYFLYRSTIGVHTRCAPEYSARHLPSSCSLHFTQSHKSSTTGETEASSPAADGRNAARGCGMCPSSARLPGARRSLPVRRDQFGDLIRASLNGGLVASTRQLASDVLGCIVLPRPACMLPPHAVRLAAGPDARINPRTPHIILAKQVGRMEPFQM